MEILILPSTKFKHILYTSEKGPEKGNFRLLRIAFPGAD